MIMESWGPMEKSEMMSSGDAGWTWSETGNADVQTTKSGVEDDEYPMAISSSGNWSGDELSYYGTFSVPDTVH